MKGCKDRKRKEYTREHGCCWKSVMWLTFKSFSIPNESKTAKQAQLRELSSLNWARGVRVCRKEGLDVSPYRCRYS